jgi:hypothetical protein
VLPGLQCVQTRDVGCDVSYQGLGESTPWSGKLSAPYSGQRDASCNVFLQLQLGDGADYSLDFRLPVQIRQVRGGHRGALLLCAWGQSPRLTCPLTCPFPLPLPPQFDTPPSGQKIVATYTIQNANDWIINLGPIQTASTGGIFRLYNRCLPTVSAPGGPPGWCYYGASGAGQIPNLQATVSGGCSGAANVAATGTPRVISVNATTMTSPGLYGIMYSEFASFRDSGCRNVLRIVYNCGAACAATRVFSVRQVRCG